MGNQSTLRVTDFAFFDKAEMGDTGSLTLGNRLKPDDINIERMFACFVVAGAVGTYKLSIRVRSEGMEMEETPISFKPRDVNIKRGAVSVRVVIPLPIGKLPSGHYVFSVLHGDAQLATFGFAVSKPR